MGLYIYRARAKPTQQLLHLTKTPDICVEHMQLHVVVVRIRTDSFFLLLYASTAVRIVVSVSKHNLKNKEMLRQARDGVYRTIAEC